MTNLVNSIIASYNEALEANKDPMIDSWFLMPSIIPITIILVVYILFVLIIGPAFMKNREAFSLKGVLIFYNAYQVLFSMMIVSIAFRTKGVFNVMVNYCNITDIQEETRLAVLTGVYWYFFSKIVDLLDTVFFVLRKKQTQVTFLHVYHHFVMVLITWIYIKLMPGEQGVFLGFLNSIVHIIMYSYYLIAALGPQYQKYIWWKKYMTLLQLIQFVIMGAFLANSYISDCKVPKILTYTLVMVVTMFFVLFMDFYIKQYKKNPVKDTKINTKCKRK